MERTRKWIMVPADMENNKSHESLSNDDIITIIKLSKQNHINDKGELMMNGIPVITIEECLKEKSKNQYYKHYLQLKAEGIAPVKKQKRGQITKVKTVVNMAENKITKSKKDNKKSTSVWEW